MTKRPFLALLLGALACSTADLPPDGAKPAIAVLPCIDTAGDGAEIDVQDLLDMPLAPDLTPDQVADLAPDVASDTAIKTSQDALTGDPCTSGPIVNVSAGQSIQAAAAGAAAGSVLHIAPGSYAAFAVANKPLTYCCDPGVTITGSTQLTAGSTKTLADGSNTVVRCEFTGGSPGLGLSGYAVVLDSVRLHHNPGGGITTAGYPIPPSLEIRDSRIEDGGRGLDGQKLALTIARTTFARNVSASADGGGFRLCGGSTTITDSVFEGNRAPVIGGGGAISDYCGPTASGTLARNVWRDNVAGSHTGGLFVDGAVVTAEYEIATGNLGGTNFGGAFGVDGASHSGTIQRGSLTCSHCSVTQNGRPGAPGGGVLTRNTDGPGDASFPDSIVWGNSTDIGVSPGTVVTITHSCWSTSQVAGTLTSSGQVNADPLFVSAPSDLHLQPGSPAVGMGAFP